MSSLLRASPAAAFTQTRTSPRRPRRCAQPVQATIAPLGTPAHDDRAPNDKPDWAGEDKLSQIVNSLISNKVGGSSG